MHSYDEIVRAMFNGSSGDRLGCHSLNYHTLSKGNDAIGDEGVGDLGGDRSAFKQFRETRLIGTCKD